MTHCSQVAQGGCGCPIPAGIQGQAGCGSGQPGLLVGDSAHSRGLKIDEHCGPFQPRPFYDSMKREKKCFVKNKGVLKNSKKLRSLAKDVQNTSLCLNVGQS